ncbi:MAG: acylphosphatase [Halomonadaceae bacterium]|nr:MAG: acylphosphatase [Halomonadaceae bacterium]
MNDVCIRVTISGNVQGVGFREATRKKATPMGITGYAKNLADGRVQVKACGDEEAVNRLLQWLHKGPERAQVTDVAVTELPLELPLHFTIR